MRNPEFHDRPSPAPDVFDTMRADHRAVLDRLAALEADADRIGAGGGRAEDEARVRAFVAHLEAQFATHMRAEDELLYPALAAELPDTRSSLAPLRAEHAELRAMLAALRDTLDETPGAGRNEQLAVQATDLADLLRIHIRKEEAVVFAVAERLLPPGERSALRLRLARPAATATTHGAPDRRDAKKG